MPLAAVRQEILTQYAVGLIRHKAHQLCRRPGFNRSDEPDLAQELTLRLLEKAHLYDPNRGATRETFANRVISSAVKMILRDRQRHKRVIGLNVLSLDTTAAIVDGKPVLLREMISETDRARVCLRDRHPEQPSDLIDLLSILPAELADVARRLQEGSVASVARDLGTSRHWVYARLSQLRRRLESFGVGRNNTELFRHSASQRHRSSGHSTEVP